MVYYLNKGRECMSQTIDNDKQIVRTFTENITYTYTGYTGKHLSYHSLNK